MARRSTKRRFTAFSLSFLDVMSNGFGAVVLVFLIINHRIDDHTLEADRDLLSESRKLDYLIDAGEENLVDLEQRLEAQRKRVDDARRRLSTAVEHRDRRRDEMQELEARTIAERQSIKELKTDIETREEEVERLQAQEEETARVAQVRAIQGEGDRQYLTGLFVGGARILIALDVSASMLDRSIVQIIRRRNMPRQRQLEAPKWQRAQRIVEWLAAQMPLASHFQIVLFNTEARTLLPNAWHKADDHDALDRALREIATVVPANGTSLQALADSIDKMSPLPDNIFLITDGLPTQSARAPRASTISGRERVELLQDTAKELPKDIPLNTILLPLEGDPLASAGYWELAVATGGTFLSPSEDWP